MQKYSKILTGFSFLDQKWNGVYPGGNYFIYGSKKSGKTILALNIIEHLLNNNHNILLITSERRKSLEIQASSVYFDIGEATSEGALKVERISEKIESIENINQLIVENNPSVLFIDEIIDKKLKVLSDSYNPFLEFLEDLEITSFFISSTPTEEKSKNFIKQIARNSTAIIQLQKTAAQKNYSGVISLKPNIGHFEGEFETAYKIEAVKGLITFSENEKALMKMFSKEDNSSLLQKKETFEYSNVYDIDEFNFLLESKLALSSKTGERFNLITYQIVDDSITTIELCNSFRTKLNKGDKICFTDKMLYILPEHNESSVIQKLSNKLDEEVSKIFKETDNIEKSLMKKVQLLKPNFKID
ncbi:MAG: AAA family ATPase [Melioribacteraceae bacterium]|nr:AAA family ATPase [Melioribacteraceae bacterium]